MEPENGLFHRSHPLRVCNLARFKVFPCLLTTEIGNCYSGGVMTASASLQIQLWPIDKLVFYARNPRKNDAAVDRMVASIR
jgi:hypothetical protein